MKTIEMIKKLNIQGCNDLKWIGILLIVLIYGCLPQLEQSNDDQDEIIKNTWYEDYRPTQTFMSLNGEWQLTRVVGDREDLWKRPVDNGETVEVPEVSPSKFRKNIIPKSEDLLMNWYKRPFTLSDPVLNALESGDDVFLHIGGVSWRWSVWVNEQLVVDGCYDVFNSKQVNVTSILKKNGENTITIAATDNHGLAENLKHARIFEPAVLADRDGDFVAPAPEILSDPILWGEVELWARPTSRIEDVFVKPDFRNKQLKVDLEITGQVSTSLEIKITDKNGNVVSLDFDEKRIAASDSSEKIKTSISAPWSDPRLWQPEDPFLYFAEVLLRDQETGAVIDTRKVRFGFRELWIEGGDLMMNGKRLFLARHSYVTGHEHSISYKKGFTGSTVREQLAGEIEKWKGSNSINSLRFHRCGYVRPGAFASYADELGLMLVPESGYCMGDRFAVNNPLFWDNSKKYLEAWVKSARNHPSIVMWSLTNEFIWCGAQFVNPEAHHLMEEQENLVKKLDPTRFIGWDGDWDLQAHDQTIPGSSETVNLHYPNESCENWYPTECWGFDNASIENPVAIRGHSRKFVWKPDSKPIIVGEYAWNNRDYLEGPENMSRYGGDKAFDWDYWVTGELAHQVVKWQTDAWRVQRFAGLNPWSYKVKGYENLMPLETVILRDAPTVYYSGEELNLEAYLLNDTQKDRDYLIDWELLPNANQGAVASAQTNIRLVGGEIEPFDLKLALPEVTAPQDYKLKISVVREGKVINTESYDLRIRPKQTIEWPKGVVLYDPVGRSTKLFSDLGITPEIIDKVEDGISQKAIIIGQNNLASTNNNTELMILEDYVYLGGNVLTLGDEKWPEQGFGPNMFFQEGKANHAWIRSEGHPMLTGISDQDLGFWGTEHWVNQHTLLKPSKGTGTAWRTLIDVGSREGLQGAVLAEIFNGRGRYVMNLLDLSKALEEPGAQALLQNLLVHISDEAVPKNAVSLLLDHEHPMMTQIKESKVLLQDWNPDNTANPLFLSANYQDVTPESIGKWVRAGGRVWLVDLDDTNADKWSKVVEGGMTLEKFDSYDGANIVAKDSILWGVSNEEFFTCVGVWDNVVSKPESTTPRGKKINQIASLAQYKINAGPNSHPLLDPSYLVATQDGKGSWLLSTIDFEEVMLKTRTKTGRFVQAMLANFNIGTEGKPIKRNEKLKTLDLRTYANRGFQDDIAGDGAGGWFDQGFHTDLHFFPQNISGFDLVNLPMPAPAVHEWPNQLTIAGVDFAFIDPRGNDGKSCMVLSKENQAITDISVDGVFDALYSLHASGSVENLSTGATLWNYKLYYSDGTFAEVPIKLGIHTADWYQPRELTEATVGWSGPTLTIKPVGLYVAKIANPYPNKKVNKIDIILTELASVSGIVGLTIGQSNSQDLTEK